jgi:hypothetical protein
VAFAPAVRGYPGGIADMAGDLDEYVADLSFDDDELWEPAAEAEPGDTTAAEPGDTAAAEPGDTAAAEPGDTAAAEPGDTAAAEPADTPSQAGAATAGAGSPASGQQVPEPVPGQQLPGESRPSAQPAPGPPPSVWQQSAAAWQEAGIDWMRPATAGPRPAGRPAYDDDPHTEPIPVLTADGSVRPAAASDKTGRSQAGSPSPRAGSEAGVTFAARVNGAGAEAGAPTVTDTAAPSPAAANAPGVAAGPGQAGRTADYEDAGAGAGGTSAGTAAGIAPDGTTEAKPGKKAGPGQKTGAGRGGKAGPGRGRTGAGRGGKAGPGRGKRGGARPGKRVMIVAVIAVALVAATLAGIGIARSGRPARPGFTLVTPYPPAVAADGELAGRTAGITPLLGSLTGIAAAGKTVVAIGVEPSQPAPVPLILLSADGGHTWARAALAAPGAGTATGPGTGAAPGGPAGPGLTTGPAAAGGPGTAPALIAHSGSTWLALGQYAAWTSPDGRTWHPAPALPPVAGDTVLGLAGTRTGFVAVGEHTGQQPGPVVWTTSAGRPWQRWTGPARGLTARSGHVTALRWAAAKGAVVVAGGPVTAAAGQGRRPGAGVWRSTDGGLTWKPVTLPASHGSTEGLAGLAASGTGFVAVRPGHAARRLDAVTYQSAQGATWRYAGKLTPVRHTSLQVTAVSGSSHGFVVAASVQGSEVAFSSARGRDWHQTTAGAGTGVAGLSAGPGGTVVVAGNSQPATGAAGIRPHLILIGPATRQQVGQAVLAASATPDVTVNALAASDRTLVAAGAAAGSPTLWLATGGHWAPGGVLLPSAWRNGALVSVVHGGNGWLAIGRASAAPSAQAPVPAAPPAAQPVILTSVTGTSWAPASELSPLAVPGNALAQAAAGPAGYVVVGSAADGNAAGGTTVGGTTAPAAWYSKNLGTWARTTLPVPGGYAPAGAPASQALAVTAAGPGFVAVGSAGNTPAAWTSRNGSAWNFTALPLPAGAAGAELTQVTAKGAQVAAAGYAWRAGSPPVPFAAVSADGGRTWRDAQLPTPPGPAVVTALTAAGHGFVAMGHTGPPGRPVMLAWWSADGLTWQDGIPAGGGPGEAIVTQINAVAAGNGTLTGAGFAASSTAEHPVLWHARYR